MSSSNASVRPLNTPRNGIPEVINTDLTRVAQSLQNNAGAIAIDTERAMGIRYANRAYLIQFRQENGEIFLIDPVGIETEFAKLVKPMQKEWILHAADQDLPCLAELGLRPTKVFDTQMAGLILGFDKVSLQIMLEEMLGYRLAKAHSSADWSKRPLPEAMLAYAALDVELLHELKNELVPMLKMTKRYAWFLEECEAILHAEPPKPKTDLWRKTANQLGIKDVRSLGMLANLWEARERLAQNRDLAPNRILPAKTLGYLAKNKPRSRSDVAKSPLLRKRVLQKDIDVWWEAIEKTWQADTSSLPSRRATETDKSVPKMHIWQNTNEEAAQRWEILRASILSHAEYLGIRQEVLLKPALQKRAAWEGWNSSEELESNLLTWGARPWQVKQCLPQIMQAFKNADL